MRSDWALIFTSNQAHEIAFANALLEENNIKAFTVNKQDSSYIFGEIELYVEDEFKYQAQLILTQHDLL